MKHPILLHIKKQFPDALLIRKPPASSAYRIAYATCSCWEAEDFTIVEQDYDGKDAYFSLIEINAKTPLKLDITCIQADLYWFYQLAGLTNFSLCSEGKAENVTVHSQEYMLIYASKRKYTLTIEQGNHLLFFFVIKADWLLRPTDEYLVHFQHLLAKLKHGKIACLSTRKLAMHHHISKEIYQLLKSPRYRGLEMDAVIYKALSRLVNRSHQDWRDKDSSKQDSLALIESVRAFIKNQIQHGEVPPISEIASTFNYSNQYLARIHKEHFGFTLQRFIIICRLEEGRSLIKEQGYTVSAAAYRLGYSQPSSFSEQFKKYYQVSPSEIDKDE